MRPAHSLPAAVASSRAARSRPRQRNMPCSPLPLHRTAHRGFGFVTFASADIAEEVLRKHGECQKIGEVEVCAAPAPRWRGSRVCWPKFVLSACSVLPSMPERRHPLGEGSQCAALPRLPAVLFHTR